MYSPGAFASDTPRLTGTEEEYHIQPARMLVASVREERLAKLGLKIASSYLSNGARLYEYSGMEYCSPECADPSETAEADFAGIEPIRAITRLPEIPAEDWAQMSAAQRKEEQQKRFPVLRLSGSFDVNTGKIETRGYHENLMFPWPEDDEKHQRMIRVLSSYLTTRIVWNGSGLVTNDGYLVSQKAPGIGAVVGDGYGNRTTHGKKPLGALMSAGSDSRDKLSAGWGIFEVRSGDAHMSRTRLFMSLAGTSLVMRLIEQDVINADNEGDFIINDPIGALHRINANYGQGEIELASGKTTTAAGLQANYFETGLAFAEEAPLTASELKAAQELARINQKLGDLSLEQALAWREIARDVEWAAKAHFLRREQENKSYTGTGIDARKLRDAAMFDLRWHSIDDNSIGLHKYAQLDPLHRTPPNLLAVQRTRAAARGKAVASGKCTGAQWNYVVLDGVADKVHLNDYWNPELPVKPGTALKPYNLW
jgi:hypothetical protein